MAREDILLPKQHLDKFKMKSGFGPKWLRSVCLCACFECAFKKLEEVLGSVGNKLLLLMLILLLLILLLFGFVIADMFCNL